jgi:hypothetical protein
MFHDWPHQHELLSMDRSLPAADDAGVTALEFGRADCALIPQNFFDPLRYRQTQQLPA